MWILALAACTSDLDPFGSGGTTFVPPEDTGDTETDDTGDSGDTSDTWDTSDTSDTSDTWDTSDTSETGDTGDTGIPGGEDCAMTAGEIACNLTLMDQAGNPWMLWNLYESGPVVVIIGNEWDSSFKGASAWLQSVGDNRGATVAMAMSQDINYNAANMDAASKHAATYSLNTVLWDPEGDRLDGWFSTTTKTYLMDSDLRIDTIITGFVAEEQLDDKLKAL